MSRLDFSRCLEASRDKFEKECLLADSIVCANCYRLSLFCSFSEND
jgi:hypothetical protein